MSELEPQNLRRFSMSEFRTKKEITESGKSSSVRYNLSDFSLT